ncbi:hypothetical protein [Saccharococcus caldoxylosilyticus]|uniref:hypothetical protein n=1 Tax=Saccharococcus caldoxylosilyticus TaxID=81408 RepID=UPI0003629AA5|nr:hypothetical protein [Parageobacillus caldoxylosilyticus]
MQQNTDNIWINKVLENCEKVGISRTIIERFIQYYMIEKRDQSAKLTSASSGFKGSSK